MRVAMLIWSYWPGHEGGAERQCRKIVRQVAGKDIDFIVLTSRFDFQVLPAENVMGGQVVRLGALAPFETLLQKKLSRLLGIVTHNCKVGAQSEHYFRALLFWLMLPMVWCSRLMFILGVWRWFVTHASMVDVVHVHETGWLAGVAAWLGKRFRIPVLAKTATNPALPKIGYDVPLRCFWHRLRMDCYFIAQHKGLADELIAQGIDRERIFLVPNGVEIPEKTASPQKAGPVLYVGNFSQGTHWKAFDVLIQAWSMVHRQCPDAQLNMVGGGDIFQWNRFATELGCEDSIYFLGQVADPATQYENSCFFVLPSRVEGISNALLEAQSFGLPCVVSDIPGNVAVVEDGVNGLVVPVGDANALAEAIIRLMHTSELRERLGQNAREKAIRFFSMQSVGYLLEFVYFSVKKMR